MTEIVNKYPYDITYTRAIYKTMVSTGEGYDPDKWYDRYLVAIADQSKRPLGGDHMKFRIDPNNDDNFIVTFLKEPPKSGGPSPDHKDLDV